VIPFIGQTAATEVSVMCWTAPSTHSIGDEEHHFRSDEQDHAIAQVKLDHRRMVAGLALADDIGPPVEHRHADADEPEQHQELAVGIVVQPHHRPTEEGQRGGGADQRPLVGRKDVIIVVLGRGHESCISL
jgi:hypothetical protein